MGSTSAQGTREARGEAGRDGLTIRTGMTTITTVSAIPTHIDGEPIPAVLRVPMAEERQAAHARAFRERRGQFRITEEIGRGQDLPVPAEDKS